MRRKTKSRIAVVVITVLALAVIGLVGYIVWQNVSKESADDAMPVVLNTTEAAVEDDAAKPEEVTEMGTITGSLTFPSEGIPADMMVHAVNLDTGKEYTTMEQLKGSEYTYGVGYSIEVPAGRYNVYGMTSQMSGTKAYYNKFITCGMSVECTDTSKIEVTVEAGENVADITVGDWWSN